MAYQKKKTLSENTDAQLVEDQMVLDHEQPACRGRGQIFNAEKDFKAEREEMEAAIVIQIRQRTQSALRLVANMNHAGCEK